MGMYFKKFVVSLIATSALASPALSESLIVSSEKAGFSAIISENQTLILDNKALGSISNVPGRRLPKPPRPNAPRNVRMEVCCSFYGCQAEYDPNLGSSCSSGRDFPKCDMDEAVNCFAPPSVS